MKKISSIGLICILLAGLLSGCKKELKADCDTVYVQKKGTITGVVVEAFDKEYYDEKELKDYIDQEVEAYQDTHGKKSVKVSDFSVKDDTAKLYTEFEGYGGYQEFNKVTLFSGTVPQALSAGYDFEAAFQEVKDGKLGKSVNTDTILGSEDKVVVLSEKIDVKVDGTIKYVSADYAQVKSKDTVSLKLPEDAEDGKEAALVYIVYE